MASFLCLIPLSPLAVSTSSSPRPHLSIKAKVRGTTLATCPYSVALPGLPCTLSTPNPFLLLRTPNFRSQAARWPRFSASLLPPLFLNLHPLPGFSHQFHAFENAHGPKAAPPAPRLFHASAPPGPQPALIPKFCVCRTELLTFLSFLLLSERPQTLLGPQTKGLSFLFFPLPSICRLLDLSPQHHRHRAFCYSHQG